MMNRSFELCLDISGIIEYTVFAPSLDFSFVPDSPFTQCTQTEDSPHSDTRRSSHVTSCTVLLQNRSSSTHCQRLGQMSGHLNSFLCSLEVIAELFFLLFPYYMYTFTENDVHANFKFCISLMPLCHMYSKM